MLMLLICQYLAGNIFVNDTTLDFRVASGNDLCDKLIIYSPYFMFLKFYTGRYSPNAWPSASMLQRSPFVQAAVNKPWYTYLLTLLQISPVHVIGIVGALVLAAVMLPRLLCGMLNGVADGAQSPPPGVSDTPSSPSPEVSSEDHPLMQSMSRVHSSAGSASGMPSSAAALQPGAGSRTGSASTIAAGPSLQSTEPPSAVRPVVSMCMLQVLVLSLWPLSFLVGLTLLGSLGSGFQSRFLLPMLPVTCLLSVYFVQWAQQQATADKGDLIMRCLSNALAVVMQLYVVHSVLNVLYYGIMFAPLYADLDVSVVDIVCGILSSAYHAPVSRESFQEMMMFVKHFGLMK